jgi:hypothetical protein
MSTIIDATIGGASANSYVTLAEATAYFATRLYVDDWAAAASDTAREQALIMAARRIDEEDFIGYRASSTQSLKWPRLNAQKPDSFAYYEATEIPQLVKVAQFEYALLFVGSDETAQSDLANYKKVKVGPIEIELNQPVSSGVFPAEAARLLRDLRINSSGATIVRA